MCVALKGYFLLLVGAMLPHIYQNAITAVSYCIKANLLQLKLLLLLLSVAVTLTAVIAVCLRCLSGAAVSTFLAESLANPQPHINQSLINLSPQTRKIKKENNEEEQSHKRGHGCTTTKQLCNADASNGNLAAYTPLHMHTHTGTYVCIYVSVCKQ